MKSDYYVYLLLDPRKFFLPFYVGKGCGNRAHSHLHEKKTANKFKSRVISAIRKKGLEPKILYWCKQLTHQQSLSMESDLIMRFGRRGIEDGGILTNSVVSAEGVCGHSETRQKISDANKGKRRIMSEATKQKLREAALNRSPELIMVQKQRMLDAASKRVGVKQSPEAVAKRIPQTQSAEANEKRSQALKGRVTSTGMLGRRHSDETKMKMSEARKRKLKENS